MTKQHNMICRAFELAYFIHPVTKTAVHIATDALDYLEVAANRQHKRTYYEVNKRYKVAFNDLHLLQQLVYQASEAYERSSESTTPHNNEESMIVHFIKYLVSISTQINAFHVSVGVTRILYNYTTTETSEIFNAVSQDPEESKDGSYIRARKKYLFARLKKRFGDHLRTCHNAFGEERFVKREWSERFDGLVRDCLKHFIPWETMHVIPLEYDPITDELTSLLSKAGDPDTSYSVEMSRMHALLDPECFGRLIAGLGYGCPDGRLTLPLLMTPLSDDDDPSHRGPAPPLSEANVSSIFAELAWRADKRKHALPSIVRILIDGTEKARFILDCNHQTTFLITPDAQFVEVRTLKEEDDILLIAHLIKMDEEGRICPFSLTAELTEGKQFVLSIQQKKGSDLVFARINVAHTEAPVLSNVAAWMLRIRKKIYQKLFAKKDKYLWLLGRTYKTSNELWSEGPQLVSADFSKDPSLFLDVSELRRGVIPRVSLDDIIQLIHAWRDGDLVARNELVSLVYEELYDITKLYIRNKVSSDTLRMIDDVYRALMNSSEVQYSDRAHFLAAASFAMRYMIVKNSRALRGLSLRKDSPNFAAGNYQIETGDRERLDLDRCYMKFPLVDVQPVTSIDITALNYDLFVLSKTDKQLSQIVGLRFFGGMSIQEIADVLKVSVGELNHKWRPSENWMRFSFRWSNRDFDEVFYAASKLQRDDQEPYILLTDHQAGAMRRLETAARLASNLLRDDQESYVSLTGRAGVVRRRETVARLISKLSKHEREQLESYVSMTDHDRAVRRAEIADRLVFYERDNSLKLDSFLDWAVSKPN